MAATTMATAAGAVVLMYYVLSRRLSAKEEDEVGGEYSKSPGCRSVKRRLSRRPAQAPATWLETISTLAETLRFTYSETLGKWPIGDLAFGINYLIRRQVGVGSFVLFSPRDFTILAVITCFISKLSPSSQLLYCFVSFMEIGVVGLDCFLIKLLI